MTMADTIMEQDTFAADFERFEESPAVAKSDWLSPARRAAMSRFSELGFPTTDSEAWRYTNIAPIAETAFRRASGEAEANVRLIESVTSWDKGASRLVFLNGRYNPKLSNPAGLPEGVTLSSLADAMQRHRPIVESHLARDAAYDDHAFASLNTAFIEDGAFVHIGKRVVVERPIHLVFITESAGESIVSYPRVLIVAEAESQATIVETHAGADDQTYLSAASTEIVAGENTTVDHYRVNRDGDGAFHVSTLSIRQERSSNVRSHALTFGGRIVRNDVHTALDAEGCDCTLNGMYVLVDGQHVDNHLRVDHLKPHCHSWEYYKGVLNGKSRGVFAGRILVAEGAQKTDAKQTNMNLILSDEALVDTKPQLEIFADDVKCTHGATIGQIDEDALFYLRSRGLSAEAARSLLIYAFASECLDQIRVEPLKTDLQRLLFDRLPQSAVIKDVV